MQLMDTHKKIDYWLLGSDEEMIVAEELLERERFRHAMYFAHLGLEKILKAHVTKKTNEIPPKIHNLVKLADIASIDISTEQREFLGSFNTYQTEARYPDDINVIISPKTATVDFAKAKEMQKWLKKML